MPERPFGCFAQLTPDPFTLQKITMHSSPPHPLTSSPCHPFTSSPCHPFTLSPLHLLTSSLLLLLTVSSAAASDPLSQSRPFLRQHCYACHGPEKQENELRFDTLTTDLSIHDALQAWQAIVDQLNLGTMPPEERPQPDQAQVAEIVDLLSAELKQAYARQRSTGARTVLRRLNRYELRSTLRDLLHLQGNADYRPDLVTKLEDRNGNGITQWNSDDPTREFPADEVLEGLDNIGSRLVMSDFLLSQIIAAAEYSLGEATHFEKQPSLEARRYASPIRTQGPGGLQQWSRERNPGYDGIYERYREPGASTSGLGRVAPNQLAGAGVGLTARYRVTIEASAHHQRHPWGELIESRQDEPLLLGLHMADARRGGLGENPTSMKLTEWSLTADGNKRTLTFDSWLDATWFPWVGWENAPYKRGLRPSQLVEKYLPESYQPAPQKDAPQDERRAYEPAMARALFEAGYKGPHLRIYSLTIEPLDKSWPPEGHVALYGKNEEVPVADLILAFARRAFRQPVTADEVARYVQLVDAQRAAGRSRAEALRAGYTAIIASPRFYFLQESEGRLDSHELASRLSYFLWSSMPDEQLFALAAADKLTDPAVLRSQVDRLLDDPRAAAFIRRFPERWLQIYKLGSMPPPGGFYFHRAMEPEMREQIDAYFADLVRTNGSIRNLIDSDYTFLNERVAQWIYRRDDVWGDGFRKVPATAPHGGGLLTMPAIMTATANGVDTSPVVRGVWVLESVLGMPPSPPPPDVEPLSPDLRYAKSIREQLAAHRKQPACNGCHRKIYPLGFAFENFDELGLYRTHYKTPRGALEIDPSSTLADGRRVADVAGLKTLLLEREEQIVRNLTEKLLSYASGRVLEPTDRGEVDLIVAELAQQKYGLRDLIRLVVLSDIFLSK